jgi:hypothetical protein
MGAAAAPILIGSALGAATNSRNPLQGALLGGVLGGVGGSFMGGFGNASNAAMTATGTTAGGVPAAITGATPVTTLPAQGVGTFAKATMPGVVSTNTSTGLIPSMTAPATMADRFSSGIGALKSDISNLGSFAKENPFAASMAFQGGKNILFPERPPMMQAPDAGLLRGNQVAPIEQPQFAMARPQVSLI